MKPAEITWINGQPYSKQFGDIYFSTEGGLDESRYVFLQHNDLPNRWIDQRHFTIIETGFGTGLNFLATWQLWQKTAPKNAKLSYIAVEQFPLKIEDLELALAAYPELAKFAKALQSAYPPLVEGFYPIELNDPSVQLTLLWGDANELLPQLVAKADASYLDGFAPKKNPEIWHDKIFHSLARLSKAGTSFATFTAAGIVKRGLEEAGFSIEKNKGFGPKKEMLYGKFKGGLNEPVPAWFALPQSKICHGKIAVIGGGIAGIACAYRLSKRGYKVDLYEAQPELANGASSNPKALLKPQLSPNLNLADQFYTEGFFYSSQIIQNLDFPIEAKLQGLLQLASNESSKTRFRKIKEKRELPPMFVQFLDKASSSKMAGIDLACESLYFPLAGTVNIRSLCRALIKACGDRLQIHTGTNISKLEHDQDWALYDRAQLIGQADIVIIANAFAARELNVCQNYPLSPLPGQLSLVAASQTSQALRLPLSYEGHITPASDGIHFIGTTYRHGREDDVTESQRDHLLVESTLNKIAPELNLNFKDAKGWISSRSVTPDHMPLVGPIADKNQFDQAYQKLAQGKQRHAFQQAQYLPNLYISAGHGSKGLSSSLLSAEVIACLIAGEGLPVSSKVYQAIHPSRFWLRQLKSPIAPL